MRLRSFAFPLLLIALDAVALRAQGRVIDEGSFDITVKGSAARTENFKITRNDNGLITATGQLLAGMQQVTSSLIADASGTPVKYEVAVLDNGAQTFRVSAVAVGARLTSMSANQRGDESMHEFPLAAGRSLIVDEGLVHQLYFAALAKGTNGLSVISPRESHATRATLTTAGLEPITVAGKTLTATHYSLTEGTDRREFWIDAAGRLLRVEIPSRQLVAARQEPPK